MATIASRTTYPRICCGWYAMRSSTGMRRKGRATKGVAALRADPASHKGAKVSGEGLLGDLIKDETLRRWAVAVYTELVEWAGW
jgi:hypothetical protein